MRPITQARFDTVKTRMQCSPPGTYGGAVDVLRKIIRKEVCWPGPGIWIVISQLEISGVSRAVQGGYTSGSWLGSYRLRSSWVVAQLSPVPDPTRHDGTNSRFTDTKADSVWPRPCRSYGWMHEVHALRSL